MKWRLDVSSVPHPGKSAFLLPCLNGTDGRLRGRTCYGNFVLKVLESGWTWCLIVMNSYSLAIVFHLLRDINQYDGFNHAIH
jgi:hypothetical protein